MSKADDLLILVGRIRRSMQPDREIDEAITKVLQIEPPSGDDLPSCWPPRYTLDISEARSLIPPNVAWWVRKFARGDIRAAVALAPMNTPDEFGHEARTEALAICLAAIAARHEMQLAREQLASFNQGPDYGAGLDGHWTS